MERVSTTIGAKGCIIFSLGKIDAFTIEKGTALTHKIFCFVKQDSFISVTEDD